MDQQQRNDETEVVKSETTHSEYDQKSAESGETDADAASPRQGGWFTQKEMVEWIKAIAIAALLVFVIRYFLFAPFIVDGPSMQPNFHTGERLIVNKLIFDIRQPKRGEVVVFHVPEEGRDFIKRVIGVPGDKVKYDGDDLYINGEKVDEPYLKESIDAAKARGEIFNKPGLDTNFPNENFDTDVVPEGTILAFGDNRVNSKDSRMIGFIPMDRIVGRADIIFWPMSDMKIVKHG